MASRTILLGARAPSLKLLHLALACLAASGLARHAKAQMEVTYTGNNGVMLSSGGNKVLIDSLQDHLNSFWIRLPQTDLQKMIAGDAPFDGISYALATHNHPDHYSRTPVLNFLSNNPQATFIGPPQVRSSLGAHPQSLEISPAFQTGSILTGTPDLQIEVFHMEHFDQFGNDFSGVQDFTYLITMGGVTLFHLGDVDYIDENFQNFDFASRNIDAVVLPTFNTLLSEANRAVILDHINPRHIIATHLRAGVLATEEANVRALYPDATIFTVPLESITLLPVPEPSTAVLCATALLPVVTGVRKRRSRQNRQALGWELTNHAHLASRFSCWKRT